jgi:hypothetical protein
MDDRLCLTVYSRQQLTGQMTHFQVSALTSPGAKTRQTAADNEKRTFSSAASELRGAAVMRGVVCAFVLVFAVGATVPAGAQEQPPQDPPRIFGVLPNYATVEHDGPLDPITAKQRFRIGALDSFDVFIYPFVGFTAGLAELRKQEPSWQRGAAGYGKYYAAAFADNTIGNMLTTAVVPSMLGQDPRYFVRGEGGFWHRAGYAASRSLVTRGRAGVHQFNVSEIGGNGIAAVVSNLYYPPEERTASETIERWGMQIMWDTLSNEMKEFWPDIRRALHRHR